MPRAATARPTSRRTRSSGGDASDPVRGEDSDRRPLSRAAGGHQFAVLTGSTTRSSVQHEESNERRGLVRARTDEWLRRRSRSSGPVGVYAASSSLSLLVLGGALLLAIGALSATQAYGAPKPAPDPYPSPATTPQAPTPDPYPSREIPTPSVTPTPAPAPAPEPAPVASIPRSSSSETVEQQPAKTTPQKQEPERRANPTRKRVQTRAITPPPSTEKKSKPVAAPAVAAVAASTSGRPLALGGLALLALVAASGSLLFHLARTDRREARL